MELTVRQYFDAGDMPAPENFDTACKAVYALFVKAANENFGSGWSNLYTDADVDFHDHVRVSCDTNVDLSGFERDCAQAWGKISPFFKWDREQLSREVARAEYVRGGGAGCDSSDILSEEEVADAREFLAATGGAEV